MYQLVFATLERAARGAEERLSMLLNWGRGFSGSSDFRTVCCRHRSGKLVLG